MSLDDYSHQYGLLRRYLTKFLVEQNGSVSGRAKDKLGRLSQVQFSELCSDVSDEISRRNKDPIELPFLLVRTDFPQKRNQARQKLATLAESRFQELACEIYYELERRYPQIPKQYDSMNGPLSASRHMNASNFSSSSSYNDSNLSNKSGNMSNSRLTSRGASRPRNRNDDSLERSPPVPSSSRSPRDLRERDRERERERERDDRRGRERDRERRPSREDVNIVPAVVSTGISREEYDRMKTDMARMKNDYEIEINELKQKVIEAPSGDELLKLRDDNRILVEDLKEEREISLDSQKKLNRLKENYDKQIDSLEDLKMKLKDYEDRIDQLVADMEHLTAENTKLKEDYHESLDQLKIYKENENKWTNYSQQEKSIGYVDTADATIKMYPQSHTRYDSGKSDLFSDGKPLKELQILRENTDALIFAAHEIDPTEVLVCMKKLIVDTKEITEKAGDMEPRVKDDNDFAELAQAKDDTTDAIASVMEIAKSHAASGNQNSPIVLEDEIEHLINCVQTLIKIMNKLENTEFALISEKDEKYLDNTLRSISTKRFSADITGIDATIRNSQIVNNSRLSITQDLAYMIEDQTDIIVELIQNLIQSFKSPNFSPNEAKKQVEDIVVAVEDIEYEFHRSKNDIDSEMRIEFEDILKLLLSDVNKLSEYGHRLISDSSRTNKQKIGTISFEIAKNVKALLAIFDNV